MDWLDFFAALLSALLWPAVVIVVLVLFQDPLRQFLLRVKEVDLPGAKLIADLTKTTDEVTRQGALRMMPLTTQPAGGSGRPPLQVPPAAPLKPEEIKAIGADPQLAILNAWSEVVQALQAASPATDPTGSETEMLEALSQRANVPVAFHILVGKLRTIRDQVAQALSPPPAQAAYLYQQSARRVVKGLEALKGA